MVLQIHVSDSTNTLISLVDHDQRNAKLGNNCQGESSFRCSSRDEDLQATSLLLPIDDTCSDVDLLDLEEISSCSDIDPNNGADCSDALFLPRSQDAALDGHLMQYPSLRQTRDELLALEHHRFTPTSQETILYVHQQEVAHVLPSQCDVLVSDRATTCHILALRSYSLGGAGNDSNIMASMTHLDGPHYEACVREMIQAHKRHHGDSLINDSDNTIHNHQMEDDIFYSKAIDMEISIVGGFLDEEGHSRQISNWILRLLATIAEEEAACLQMRLRTCAISGMNHSGIHNGPIGRGLAMHVATGQTFLAKVDGVQGPFMPLRNARLWSICDQDDSVASHKLHTIHTTSCPEMIIPAFSFQPWRGMERLLKFSDDVLLEHTSTSPAVEEDDFCHVIRTTLHFLRETPCSQVFGPLCNRPLRFARRHAKSNEWIAL